MGARNWIMLLVMAVTALVGAAAAWRWGRALIGCTQKARQPVEPDSAASLNSLIIPGITKQLVITIL